MCINREKVLWKLGSINTMEFYEAVKSDIYMNTPTKWKPDFMGKKIRIKNLLHLKIRIMHNMHKNGQQSKENTEK